MAPRALAGAPFCHTCSCPTSIDLKQTLKLEHPMPFDCAMGRAAEAPHLDILASTPGFRETWEVNHAVEERAWFHVLSVTNRTTAERATAFFARDTMPAPQVTAFIAAATAQMHHVKLPIARCLALESKGLPWAVFNFHAVTQLHSLYELWSKRNDGRFLDVDDVYGITQLALEACTTAERDIVCGLSRGGYFGRASFANYYCDTTGHVVPMGLFGSLAGPDDEERRLWAVRHPQAIELNAVYDAALLRAALLAAPPGFFVPHPAVARVLSGMACPEDAVIESVYARLQLGMSGTASQRFTSIVQIADIYRSLYDLLGVDASHDRLAARLVKRMNEAGLDVDPASTVVRIAQAPESVRGDQQSAIRALANSNQRFTLSSGVVIDLPKYACERDGQTFKLTMLEARLLAYLVERPNTVVTSQELLTKVWGYSVEAESRAVSDAMKRLRKKIERDTKAPLHLQNVFGVGYQYVP